MTKVKENVIKLYERTTDDLGSSGELNKCLGIIKVGAKPEQEGAVSSMDASSAASCQLQRYAGLTMH